MLHGLENGTISFFFSDLADGEILRPTNASTQVPLSYLVFLGVNASRDGLKDASVRTALSYAVNRTALAETAFSGWANPRPPLSPSLEAGCRNNGLFHGRKYRGGGCTIGGGGV